jgi:hypothetical protein
MSQKKLLDFIGIFDISTEETADYCTTVSLTEDIVILCFLCFIISLGI